MRLVEFKPKPTARHVAAIVCCVALGLRLVLVGLELFAGLSVLGTVTLELLQFVILIAVLIWVSAKRAIWYPILGVLLALNGVLFMLHNDGAEYYLSSPSGSNVLIIEEKSALLSSGQANLYRKEYGLFKRKLPDRVLAVDQYQPFSHGQYQVEWMSEHVVRIDYYNGHGYQQLEVTM